MKKHTRFTAFFLAMVMILSLFTGMASAEEGEIESKTNSQTETSETDNTLTLQPIISEDYESFDVLKAPDIISTAEIQANGYVGRVRSQEKDLYTLVFKNSNGSYTKKIYSHPVKYVDATGVVRDISLEIGENKDGSFSTASHEIITTFKKNPVNGITLDYKDVSIRMVPALTGNKAPAAIRSADNKKITYNLDSTTAYVYELTYAGYKEDIVVKKYTGQTEYMFKLYTNGLTLTKINETYCLTDSEGEIKATVGDVIIFTADERNNTFGSMTYQTVRQNQEYIITIHVDADYLKDPKTVYPIRIDPTVEIKYENNGSGAIEDVTINSNAGSDGSSTSLLIGKRNTYGISRVLLRVPELDFTGVPYAASITSATISLRDIMCESTALDIYCHQFNGGYWAESTVSWSSINANGYNSTPLSSNTISYSNGLAVGQRYTFDITDAVWDWFSDGGLKDMGLIFKASSTVENASAHNHRTFGSYNKSSYRPVFTMVYDMYTSITIHPVSMSLTEGQTSQLIASSSLPDATITWTVSDPSIASYNSATNKVTALKAGTTTITATATVPAGSYSASCAVTVYLPDGVYYIKKPNSDNYLSAENSGLDNYTDVIQHSKYASNEDIVDRLSQMWKIHHIGSGIYTVRPMHMPELALDVTYTGTDHNVDLYKKSDTNIINDIKWTIVWNSTGYVFRNVRSNYEAMCVNSSSDSVKVETYSSSDTKFRWAITAAEAVALYDTSTGAALSNSIEYVAPGETRTLSQLGIRAEYFNGATSRDKFTWRIDNTTVASVAGNTGEVTGVAAGTATINVYVRQLNNNSITATYTINVTPVANGTYYIKNKQNGTYADIEGPTMANGTEIHQWAFHGGNSQKWIFNHLGDGYYTIRSANSSVNYYMSVIDDSTELDVAIVLRSTAASDGTHWKFEVAPSGGLKIIPKCTESKKYILATDTSESTNGVRLIQGDYVSNTSYRDEWFLEGDNTLTVINYYDQGFVERNVENGESHALDLLRNVNTNVAMRFEEIFGLKLIPIFVPYTSVCDTCRITNYGSIEPDYLDLGCNCPNNKNCLSSGKVLDDAVSKLGLGTDKITYVLWTGHKMSSESDNASWSQYVMNIVGMTPHGYGIEDGSEALATKVSAGMDTLTHELSHQLGTLDHYCKIEDSIWTEGSECSNPNCDRCYRGYGEIRQCIMGKIENIHLVTDLDLYCSECISIIQNHINEHH